MYVSIIGNIFTNFITLKRTHKIEMKWSMILFLVQGTSEKKVLQKYNIKESHKLNLNWKLKWVVRIMWCNKQNDCEGAYTVE